MMVYIFIGNIFIATYIWYDFVLYLRLLIILLTQDFELRQNTASKFQLRFAVTEGSQGFSKGEMYS